jgi:hypothetical protein
MLVGEKFMLVQEKFMLVGENVTIQPVFNGRLKSHVLKSDSWIVTKKIIHFFVPTNKALPYELPHRFLLGLK